MLEQLIGEVLEVLEIFLRVFEAFFLVFILPVSLSFGQRLSVGISWLLVFVIWFIFEFFVLVCLLTH